MVNENIYYKYSDYLKKHYNAKVYKLPVNLAITCPNRLGGKGCTFCSEVGTGFESLSSDISVTEQLNRTRQFVQKKYKAEKFIAYFQNYTNTFMPIEKFALYVEEAAQMDGIIEIAISTRPDCIRDDYLDVLHAISYQYKVGITIELGLQSANYHTLEKINRGHGLSEYLDACMRIKSYGFFLCTHVILNLPYDMYIDVIETSRIVSIMKNDLVKIHSLYIAKDTYMADQYLRGELQICSKEEYFERLRLFIENLDAHIAVERLFSRIPEKDSVFSNWNTSWWKLQDEFMEYMKQYGSFQGKNCFYSNGSALKLLENDMDNE
ncbi:MAG: TIGR01212 family radical SAM protein [Lachnospiraceae bacterium]|nr:TIGR01212 family radical SAM protein [Lachnospiraceae bacterium]